MGTMRGGASDRGRAAQRADAASAGGRCTEADDAKAIVLDFVQP
jgi:hypothetical protein